MLGLHIGHELRYFFARTGLAIDVTQRQLWRVDLDTSYQKFSAIYGFDHLIIIFFL